MKKIVSIMVVAVLFFSMNAFAAAGKIASVDTQTVFDRAKLGKRYQAIIREYYESRKKILDLDADEIQKLQDDYAKQKKGGVLTDDGQKKLEDTLNRKIAEFQKKREEFSGEISKKNEELSAEFNQKMMAILKEMAKKDKFSLVLNKNINILSKSDVPSVLYAEDESDITDKVIAEMDKREEAKQ